jgi:hypothetical protein
MQRRKRSAALEWIDAIPARAISPYETRHLHIAASMSESGSTFPGETAQFTECRSGLMRDAIKSKVFNRRRDLTENRTTAMAYLLPACRNPLIFMTLACTTFRASQSREPSADTQSVARVINLTVPAIDRIMNLVARINKKSDTCRMARILRRRRSNAIAASAHRFPKIGTR